MRRSIRVESLLFCAAIAVVRVSGASPLTETLGPVGGDGGFNATASGASAASVYFNPALLVDADDVALVAYSLLTEQPIFSLDGRRPGAEVPLSVGGRAIVGRDGAPISNASVPTQWLNDGCAPGTAVGQCSGRAFRARPRQSNTDRGVTRSYLTLGIVRHAFDERLALGIYVSMPLTKLTTASSFYADAREALFTNSLHSELYGDRMTAISISAGAAWKLVSSFSVGFGVSLGLTNTATSQTYVRDSVNYDTLLLDNNVGVATSFSPYVGFAFHPSDRLRIGATVHAPESFRLETDIIATLPNGAESSTHRDEVHNYLPWRFALGAEAAIAKSDASSWSLVGSLKHARWSSYEDRHGESPQRYGADLAWKNTFAWAVGVRPRFGAVRTFLDLQYTPTPVPEQIGASNYVDSDRVGVTVGGDYAFRLAGSKLRVGASFLGQRLLTRHNTKDDARIRDELPDDAKFAAAGDPVPGATGLQTNNPGWPGFSSGGWIYGGSVTLEVLVE